MTTPWKPCHELATMFVRLIMPHTRIVLEHCPLFLQEETACPSPTSLVCNTAVSSQAKRHRIRTRMQNPRAAMLYVV